MAKRSSGTFERMARDFYVTPPEAVIPLLPHLDRSVTYGEPCAGDGSLVRHLQQHGVICEWASDVLPQVSWVQKQDAFLVTHRPSVWITNPPWDRKLLHPLITKLSDVAPCWLLFDADWPHTKQAKSMMHERCVKVVSVGRVKWFPGTKSVGKDNCAWYYFRSDKTPGPTQFFGRI